MKTFRRFLACGVFIGLTGSAFAAPANTAVLDGRPTEYDAFDLRGTYTGGGGAFGAGTYITNLFVTWDADYLYIALQGAEVNDKLVVMIDADPGSGTGAGTTTNWTGNAAGYIGFNDVGWVAATNAGAPAFGLDYMVATEGFFNNVVRVLYDGIAAPTTANVEALFDSGNGAGATGLPVDMVAYGDATACDLKGMEARIPWSVLFPTNGPNAGRFGVVGAGQRIPVGAVLRVFANIHNNNNSSAFSSNDAIPQQTGPFASWSGGLLITDTYIDINLDLDSDGLPDIETSDVNAPWLRYASGLQGGRKLFAAFNEPLNATTATTPGNWQVNGSTPTNVVMSGTNAVLLDLTNDLANFVIVAATNVADVDGNYKLTTYCLSPAATGLTNPITVRFVLETSSGLGLNPGASNFFLNGGSFPLEFGFPPATSTPMLLDSGTVFAREVVFPPGTPATLSYKYSGQLTTTGTNTYEGVRLADFANAARVLTLPSGVSSLVVTDHLGAAAAPFRRQEDATNRVAFYNDVRRGDAGVRRNTQVTFQLDLNNRDLANIARVIVEGTDPLRGFNVKEQIPTGVSDYPAGGSVGWQNGGIELNDDGLNGDAVAGDGIFSRTWLWSVDGTDVGATFVPDFPYSLVSGTLSEPPPFFGDWADRRSPRSFKYKFAVVRNDDTALEITGSDLEYYIEDSVGTNVLLAPFVWNNEALPLPPPSNAPAMLAFVPLAGNQVRVQFENNTNELQHGVLISTNLLQGWMDFGLRASGAAGNWTAVVANANPSIEAYAAFAGPAKPGEGLWFHPNPLPSTGGTLRVWYRQHGRSLTGARNVGLTGPWNGWNNGQPMTFVGDGAWYYDLQVGLSDSTVIVFKARTTDGNWDSGPDVLAYKGIGRMTWTPTSPTNGEVVTITYDANGGPLAAATNLNAYVGFDEGWFEAGNRPMTNTLGQTNIWEIAFAVPTNRTLSINAVFNNGSTWDSEGNPGTGGRQNRIFISPRPFGIQP